jgi:hypothetical protein
MPIEFLPGRPLDKCLAAAFWGGAPKLKVQPRALPSAQKQQDEDEGGFGAKMVPAVGMG